MPGFYAVGFRVGKIVVTAHVGKIKPESLVEVACDCGVVRTYRAQHLDLGVRSCGCSRYDEDMRSRSQASRWPQHIRYSGSPTHVSWRSMLNRCYATSVPSYPRYGGIGVVVCERWRADFQNFLMDMGLRPSGTTLDRFPNRSGNYEPGNCRWATPTEQSRNRSSTRLTFVDAQQIWRALQCGDHEVDLAKIYGVSRSAIHHIKMGLTFRDIDRT